MSLTTATARRWFVPDRVFLAQTNDYALVCHSAASVREDLFPSEAFPPRLINPNKTFHDAYEDQKWSPIFHFAIPGTLLFADVDDTNEEHKRHVYEELAHEVPLDVESDATIAARAGLEEYLGEKWYYSGRDIEDADGMPTGETEQPTEGERKQWISRELAERIQHGDPLDHDVIDYILAAPSEAAKRQLLDLVSGQTRSPTTRPVLALIGIVDDQQATERDHVTGWTIAHNLARDLLIIKPFHSRPGHHPLSEPWSGQVARDDVSFCGAPAAFAATFLNQAAALGASRSHNQNGFRLLVHLLAAHWLRRHPSSLDVSTLEAAMGTVKQALAGLAMPIVGTKTRELELDKQAEVGAGAQPFRYMQALLEAEEEAARAFAVRAKVCGDWKGATGAAETYEALLGTLRAFNGGEGGKGGRGGGEGMRE